jgi:transposase
MVELVRSGRTPAELARDFDVTAQTIANWVGAAGGQASRMQAAKGA